MKNKKVPKDVKGVVTGLLDRFFGTIKYNSYIINANKHKDIVRGTAEVSRNPKYITLCCSDKTKKLKKPREIKNVITAWDLKNHEWLTIKADDIIEVEFLEIANHTPRGQTTPFDILTNSELESEFDEDNYVKDSLFRIKQTACDNIECHETEFNNILKACNITPEEFLSIVPHEEETFLKEVRIMWMDKIRNYRNKALEELDELEEETKKNTDNEDDLEDVNTIKQMFRDIPQETDLNEFKDLDTLLDFWPSLLFPRPDLDDVLEEE